MKKWRMDAIGNMIYAMININCDAYIGIYKLVYKVK